MARRGLNNVVREKHFRNGQESWKLETKDGSPVPAFDLFCEKNAEYSFRTQKRYAEVVSRFIDYLYEARVFDQSVSPTYLNAVVEAYPILLRDGSEVTASRVRKSGSDLWLADVAARLNWTPLAAKSFDNTIAAVNRFLRLSESLAREVAEKAVLLGVGPKDGYTALIKALDGTATLSRHEVGAMKQHSMFGNVAKFVPKGILRPRGLRSPGTSSTSARRILDFPQEALPALIAAAETWRDKCLWLLLAATGIRISEALNLHLEDIDAEAQKVYVFDPNGRRAQLGDNDPNRMRFKGREMACTYFIPDLRRDFFYALQQYLNLEFVPCYRHGEPAYLFQYVEPARRGWPLVDASHSALAQSFKAALRSANIAVPKEGKDWVLHSLRHMYGVYMVNDFPVDPEQDQFGLALVEVQMMMGHKSIRSTAHYARSKQRRLEAKLAASDQAMLGMSIDELKALPIFNIRLSDGAND
ncbi:site-specific integrase [Variovorax beijingensis]|uniref:Site-specific integrase n=1 Tax=Variovorax beijingensis TaxID=2496117 RepID=A0A3P3EM51_9BURK|nr:site-specific integrase [Variovorax beijingensis]RRH86458.1 site-specific integrase [Variovorax beijingensis]